MLYEDNWLAHHGVKGQRWGVIRKDDKSNPAAIRTTSGSKQPTMSKVVLKKELLDLVSNAMYKKDDESTSDKKEDSKSTESKTKAEDKKTTYASGSTGSSGSSESKSNSLGRYGSGNIDLDDDSWFGSDEELEAGSFCFKVKVKGKLVLIPGIINGKSVTQKEAEAYYKQSGMSFGQFKSENEANRYIQKLISYQKKKRNKNA